MKLVTVLSVAALSLVVAGAAFAQEPCTSAPQTETLIAGQNFYAGTVTVAVEGGNVCVTFETTGGWQLTETHLAIATSLAGLPQTKSGNPSPGKFPYSAKHKPAVTTFTYCVPFDVTGEPLYIATHAVAELADQDTGAVVQQETAWAGPEDFPGKNWATYFVYIPTGCRPEDEA